MKVLVLGGSGLLGHKLVQVFRSRFETSATFHTSFQKYRDIGLFAGVRVVENVNVEEFDSVARILADIRPDVIVNAIGVTKHVPDGEDAITAITINSLFPHRLAQAAARHNARLICMSTDCVFSGKKGNYVETDAADAIDLYGKTKNLGEVVEGNCLTVRTSIIGRELFTRNSLVEWFLSNRGSQVKGFRKAIFTGFPTLILAELLADVIETKSNLSGLYHVSSDKINKFNLLELINKEMNVGARIEAEDDFAVDRSLDSTRFKTETGFVPLAWPEMIKRMADDAVIYENIKQ